MAAQAGRSASSVDPLPLGQAAREVEAGRPQRAAHVALAIDEDAAGHEPPARAASPRGADARGSTSSDAMRLARTRSNGPSGAGSEPWRACTRRAHPLRRAFAGSPRPRSGPCPAPAPGGRRSRPRRGPGCPSRSPRRGRGRRRASPASARRSTPARHSRVVGWRPVPNAIPGSSASTTSPGRRRWRRQVGRMTMRRPIRSTGKCVLPRLGPVGLAHDAPLELADRPQPEGLQVAEGRVGPGDGRLDRVAVRGLQVGAHDRRPGRVQARAQALVDQHEGGLHA